MQEKEAALRREEAPVAVPAAAAPAAPAAPAVAPAPVMKEPVAKAPDSGAPGRVMRDNANNGQYGRQAADMANEEVSPRVHVCMCVSLCVHECMCLCVCV